MKILDSNSQPLDIQPVPMSAPITIDGSNKNLITFWTVPADGSYFLNITGPIPAVNEALQWYYLTAWEANGNTTILQHVDILRDSRVLYRYLYFQTPSTLILGHSGGSDKLDLYKAFSGTQYKLEAL